MDRSIQGLDWGKAHNSTTELVASFVAQIGYFTGILLHQNPKKEKLPDPVCSYDASKSFFNLKTGSGSFSFFGFWCKRNNHRYNVRGSK